MGLARRTGILAFQDIFQNFLAAADQVATGIKYALNKAGIDMPFPLRRILVEAPGQQAPAGPSSREA